MAATDHQSRRDDPATIFPKVGISQSGATSGVAFGPARQQHGLSGRDIVGETGLEIGG